jgi:hypothetical protein
VPIAAVPEPLFRDPLMADGSEIGAIRALIAAQPYRRERGNGRDHEEGDDDPEGIHEEPWCRRMKLILFERTLMRADQENARRGARAQESGVEIQYAPDPENTRTEAYMRAIAAPQSSCRSGIGRPANRYRHGHAIQRARRAERLTRALSVAIPVFAYIWR